MEQKNLDQIIRETVARYMNRSLIVAGNWKMNMTVREGMEFLEKLGPVDGKVMIFPPYTTLAVLAGEFRKRGIIYGPQNFHYKESGAYTGEISLPMIRELGCDCLLVGHSERRSYYNETDEEIQKKISKKERLVMKKRVLSLALAAAMAASLTACSGNSSTTETTAAVEETKAAENANTESKEADGSGVDVSDWKNKTVTCIVPYDAGGGTDTVMRALADAAKGSFKNISVENRSGGGGATGMLAGANAAADGTTVTMITVELATLEAMGTNAGLTYSMFKPIMMVNSACAAITVNAKDDRFNTIEDFINYAKENEVSMGNSGNGAIWHLAAAGLAKETGAQFKHVAYDGAAGAITDLLGEHIDAVAVSYAEVANYVESGDLKVLAVMNDKRLDSIPDVPTCQEAGYNVVLGTWRGLGVPKDTPDEVVDQLYEIFSQAAESDAFVDFMNKSNNVIDVLDGATFEERIKSDLETYTALVTDLGLKVQ